MQPTIRKRITHRVLGCSDLSSASFPVTNVFLQQIIHVTIIKQMMVILNPFLKCLRDGRGKHITDKD